MTGCSQCGKPMKVGRENVKYDASGLPGITLENIEVRRCPGCGEYEVVIPRLEELHALIATAILQKSARLTGDEIRYLRKFLGWSGADFARMIGAKPETVSRWETGNAAMGVQADRLLRLMVAHLKPVQDYGADRIKNTATVPAKPARLKLTNDAKGWHQKAA
jgi:putative zinc finger/helix-turn-helix YgiT family protein